MQPDTGGFATVNDPEFSSAKLHALELHPPPWRMRQEAGIEGNCSVVDSQGETVASGLNVEEAVFMAQAPVMFVLLQRIARSPMSLRGMRIAADDLVRALEATDAAPPDLPPPQQTRNGVV